jgi:hypothetical protein
MNYKVERDNNGFIGHYPGIQLPKIEDNSNEKLIFSTMCQFRYGPMLFRLHEGTVFYIIKCCNCKRFPVS